MFALPRALCLGKKRGKFVLKHTAQKISLDDVTKGTYTSPSFVTPPTASCGLCPLRPPCFCLLSCMWKVARRP